MSDDSREAEKFPRRELFRRTARIGAAALALVLRGSERARTPEKEHPKVAVLDLFDLEVPETGSGMGTKIMEEYGSHGKNVVETLTKTAKLMDPAKAEKLVIVTTSIVPAVTVKEVEPDRLGNPQVEMEVSKAGVEEIISGVDAKVINMSFELGKNRIRYQMFVERKKYPEMGRQLPQERNGGYQDYLGKPISEAEYKAFMAKDEEKEKVTLNMIDRDLKFVDGYAGKDTFENLSQLAELARKFPDKTFVAAGGNPTFTEEGTKTPDIREARKRLVKMGMWPDNVIIVGVEYERQGTIWLGCVGADVSVEEEDLKNLSATVASSFATPVVTELVRQRGKQEVLEGLTETREWWGVSGSERMEYKVLKMPK